MKLNMVERLRLLEILPTEGNRMNLKIVRKLRETLSFSEAEIKVVVAVYEFICQHISTDDDGTRKQCGITGFYSGSPNCKEHPDEPMTPTGNWRILNMDELIANVKDVYMGEEAIKLAEIPLKRMEDIGKLTEAYTSLYDKFFPPREEEKD